MLQRFIHQKISITAAGLGVFWFLLPNVAFTTLLNYLSLKDLSIKADEIVLATVTATHADWYDKQKSIWTTITLQINHSLKGELKPKDTIIIKQAGGIIPEKSIAQKVVGNPEFLEKQEILIFLQRLGENQFRPLGLSQGVFYIRTQGERKEFYRNLTGIRFIERNPPANEELFLQSKAISYEKLLAEIEQKLHYELNVHK